jgi:hypothetical protein
MGISTVFWILSSIAFTIYFLSHWLTELTHSQVEIFNILFTISYFIVVGHNDVFKDFCKEDEAFDRLLASVLGLNTSIVVVNEGLEAVGYLNFAYLIIWSLLGMKAEEKTTLTFTALTSVVYVALSIFIEEPYVPRYWIIFWISPLLIFFFLKDKESNL